jgi:hypothetical protein
MTREEHLVRCKQRALGYVDRGDLHEAFTSMWSDLRKHPETAISNPYLWMLGAQLVQARDANGLRRYIEGFR